MQQNRSDDVCLGTVLDTSLETVHVLYEGEVVAMVEIGAYKTSPSSYGAIRGLFR